MATLAQIDVWIGLDVGKEEHFADVLDDAGERLFGRSVANNEADLAGVTVELALPAAPRT